MKKFVSLVLSLVLLTSFFTACGGAEEQKADFYGTDITPWVEFTDTGYRLTSGAVTMACIAVDRENTELSSSISTSHGGWPRKELTDFFAGLQLANTIPFDKTQLMDDLYVYFYGITREDEQVELLEPFFMVFYDDFTMAVMAETEAQNSSYLLSNVDRWQFADVAYPVQNPEYVMDFFFERNTYIPDDMTIMGMDMSRWYLEGHIVNEELTSALALTTSGLKQLEIRNNLTAKPVLYLLQQMDCEKTDRKLYTAPDSDEKLYTVLLKDPGIVSGDWELLPDVRFTFSRDFTLGAVTNYSARFTAPLELLSDTYRINNPQIVKAYFEEKDMI